MFEQVKDYKSACAAGAHVGTHLRFINKEAAKYAAKTFQPLYMKHIFGID